VSAPSPITAAIRLGFDVISLRPASPQGAGLDQAAMQRTCPYQYVGWRTGAPRAQIFSVDVDGSLWSRLPRTRSCYSNRDAGACVCARAGLGAGSVSESLHGVRGTEVTLTVAQERYAANIYTYYKSHP